MAENNRNINDRCECCGQTLYAAKNLTKGFARMMIDIAAFIEEKGVNVFHPEKEMMKLKGWRSSERNNMTTLKAHGLCAMHEEHGNWKITDKGLAFLQGKPVWRVVVTDKLTKKKIGHNTEDGVVTIKELLGEKEYWQGIGFTIESGRVIPASEIIKQQSLL